MSTHTLTYTLLHAGECLAMILFSKLQAKMHTGALSQLANRYSLIPREYSYRMSHRALGRTWPDRSYTYSAHRLGHREHTEDQSVLMLRQSVK